MAHILFNPVDTDTTVPVSALEPAGAFDFNGTPVDLQVAGQGDIVYTAGTYTLVTDVLNIDLVRVEWGLNADLNSMVNFALYANGVVVRSGVIDRAELRSGSITLTAAEVGTGVLMKLWCSDTDQADMVLAQIGTYMSVESLAFS